MAYTDFKNYGQVIEKFDLIVKHKKFLEEKFFKVDPYLENRLKKSFEDSARTYTETAICESIISPMILEVADENNITVWSHVEFNVNQEKNLVGIPDFLLGVKGNDDLTYKTPILCVGEAKRENFIAGWGQVVAEMYAAQLENENCEVPVYGLVTTGFDWRFAMLKENVLTIDPNIFVAPKLLQEVFNVLNWVFSEARKNLNVLENLEKNNA